MSAYLCVCVLIFVCVYLINGLSFHEVGFPEVCVRLLRVSIQV